MMRPIALEHRSVMDWANIVTWLIVFLGWWAVHKTALLRERRKENREAVNLLIVEIRNIEKLAIEFHTGEKFNPYISDSIIWKASHVIRFLQREPFRGLEIPETLMIQLRKDLTLSNMDASTFSSQDYHSDIIKNIRTTIDNLIDSLEAARDKVFY